MKKQFPSQLQAIEWIAQFANNECQFEILREQLLFNHIYYNCYFLSINEKELDMEVVWLNHQ